MASDLREEIARQRGLSAESVTPSAPQIALHCATCGAGPREHGECEEPDCPPLTALITEQSDAG